VCGQILDAARGATREVPIVVGACTEDMVAAGIVESLARPGGNVTGMQKLVPGLTSKELELLHALLPAAKRIAVLWNSAYSQYAPDWKNLRVAASSLGVELVSVEARRPKDFKAALTSAVREGAQAVLAVPDMQTYLYGGQLAESAARLRLPTIYPYRENAEAGGLISYGTNLQEVYRRSASHVDKILKGAKPGEIRVEQPTQFELVVNVKTAKALGVTVPQSILVRADKVIE
jgi:putative ABC transport system substrate-binding protein